MIQEGEIYIINDRLMKVFAVNKDSAIGYDIVNCTLIETKPELLSPLPEYIKHILGSENVRFQIAKSIGKTDQGAADLMGINVRTVYRIKNT